MSGRVFESMPFQLLFFFPFLWYFVIFFCILFHIYSFFLTHFFSQMNLIKYIFVFVWMFMKASEQAHTVPHTCMAVATAAAWRSTQFIVNADYLLIASKKQYAAHKTIYFCHLFCKTHILSISIVSIYCCKNTSTIMFSILAIQLRFIFRAFFWET